jgi:hypothetical protein
MRCKKSQVTVFIIIGIILVFVIFLLMYFNAWLNQKQIEDEVNEIQRILNEDKMWRTAITSCLKQTAEKGIFILGRQGGVIYDTQASGTREYFGPPLIKYGVAVLPFKGKNYDNSEEIIYDVNYGIRTPVLGSPGHPLPPTYPYPGWLIENPHDPSIHYRAYYNTLGVSKNNIGKSYIPPLCDYFGENRPNKKTLACRSYDNPRYRSVHDSMQEYLEMYIAEEMAKCSKILQNVSVLKGRTIKRGNVSVNTTITSDYIYVSADFPHSIQIKSSLKNLAIGRFDTRVKVRLRQIHELAEAVIYEDNNNIYFSASRDAASLSCQDNTGSMVSCLKENMSVTHYSDVCSFQGVKCGDVGDTYKDDIYVIEDKETQISGQPYVFQFAVQNRRPALDLIRTTESGTIAAKYDIIATVNQTIVLEPYGYDPDEDHYNQYGFMDGNYYFSGWKESYNEEFLAEKCKQFPDDCKANPEDYTYRRNVTMGLWTKSPSYSLTRRNATYTPKDTDIGLHEVQVKVCDSGDANCDWQNIKILVQNKPMLGGERTYEDISPHMASVEDPFVIAAFFFRELEGVKYYLYDDVTLPSSMDEFDIINSTEKTIVVPDALGESYDINTITNKAWKKLGTHKINMQIWGDHGGQIVSFYNDFFFVNVTQCLPHRNPDSPIFPFNTTDGFKSNHTCCLGDPWGDPSEWKPANSNTKCFSSIEYGCYRDFEEYPGVNPIAYEKDGTTRIMNTAGLENSNAVWKRTVEGYCDGVRGNICAGPKKDIRIKIADCNNECQFCQYNSTQCEIVARGTPCNLGQTVCAFGEGKEIFELADGSRKKYSVDFGTRGTIYPEGNLCSYGCDGVGNCNIAIDCSCDNAACSPECTGTDDFLWENASGSPGEAYCYFECNTEYCQFDEIDPICPNDNNGNPTACLSPTKCNNCCDPNSREGICLTGVKCTKDGTDFGVDSEYCKEPGSRMLKSFGSSEYICFDNSHDQNNKCASDGSCLTGDGASNILECDEDMTLAIDACTYSINHCTTPSGECLVPIVGNDLCTDSGWSTIESLFLSYPGEGQVGICMPDSYCGGGSYYDSPYCYYDLDCTDTGWVASQKDECITRGTNLSNWCYYEVDCDSTNGCEYERQHVSTVSCGTTQKPCCTAGLGWKCEPLGTIC